MTTFSDQADRLSPQRTPLELEMDILLALSLAEGDAAAKAIWRSVEVDPPPHMVEVAYQCQLHAGADHPADIRVRGAGLTLFVEDKVARGRCQDGQVQAYARAREEGALTVLVAPRSFVERHRSSSCSSTCAFIGHVALEDLIAAIGLSGGDPDEAARGRSWRLERLLELTKEVARQPEETVVTFRQAYRRILGEAGVRFFTLNRERGSLVSIEFKPMRGYENFGAWHDLADGIVRVKAPPWKDLQHPQRAFDAMPASARPPGHWWAEVHGGYGCLCTKVTQFDGPRDRLGPWEPHMREAANKLAAIGTWLDSGGAELLDLPNPLRFRWYLDAAAAIAEQHDRRDVVGHVAALRDILDE